MLKKTNATELSKAVKQKIFILFSCMQSNSHESANTSFSVRESRVCLKRNYKFKNLIFIMILFCKIIFLKSNNVLP